MVAQGAIRMPDHIRAHAVDLLARKKRLNLAYGMACEWREAASLRDFAAQRATQRREAR